MRGVISYAVSGSDEDQPIVEVYAVDTASGTPEVVEYPSSDYLAEPPEDPDGGVTEVGLATDGSAYMGGKTAIYEVRCLDETGEWWLVDAGDIPELD